MDGGGGKVLIATNRLKMSEQRTFLRNWCEAMSGSNLVTFTKLSGAWGSKGSASREHKRHCQIGAEKIIVFHDFLPIGIFTIFFFQHSTNIGFSIH